MNDGRNPLEKARPFEISQKVVVEAWKQVKANQGAAGVDKQSIAEFETNLRNWKNAKIRIHIHGHVYRDTGVTTVVLLLETKSMSSIYRSK